MHNKIMTEARVKRHSWDVVTYTAESVLELKQKKLIAAYDSPERKNYSEDLKDDQGTGLQSMLFQSGWAITLN